MPISHFINNTHINKFVDNFIYNGIEYQYTLYLPNFKENKKEIIKFFGNRRNSNGELCLGVNEKTVKTYIDRKYISAFIVVQKVGTDEIASGTIQIHNWCTDTSLENDNFVWINDLCRTGAKSSESPVKAFMFFVEQLVIQNLGKNDIYMFVDKTDPINKDTLMRIYKDTYGYIYNSEEDPTQCLHNRAGEHLLVMHKPNLLYDRSISFDFLLQSPKRKYSTSFGGKSKRKHHTKSRTLKLYKRK